MTMKAHFAPANERPETDTYLQPTSYDWDKAQSYELDYWRNRSKYIEITDEELKSKREASGNSLNFGDAMEELLYEKLPRYKGQVFWSKNYGLDEDDEVVYYEDEDAGELVLDNPEETAKMNRMTVLNSIRVDGVTYYFYKVN